MDPETCAFHKCPLFEKNTKFSEAVTLQATYIHSGRPGTLTLTLERSRVPKLPETPDNYSRPDF